MSWPPGTGQGLTPHRSVKKTGSATTASYWQSLTTSTARTLRASISLHSSHLPAIAAPCTPLAGLCGRFFGELVLALAVALLAVASPDMAQRTQRTLKG